MRTKTTIGISVDSDLLDRIDRERKVSLAKRSTVVNDALEKAFPMRVIYDDRDNPDGTGIAYPKKTYPSKGTERPSYPATVHQSPWPETTYTDTRVGVDRKKLRKDP